jgi:GNAT superfamily N-acetyltransferase
MELLLIRTLGRDEADLLDDVVARLSPHSRYLRFHSPIRVLGSEVRRALSDVDGRDRIGLVAEVDDGSAVGIAHMIRNEATGGTEAEVALAVADDWQRRGVGRALVTELAARARTVGVDRLTARVLPGNAAARGLFRASFEISLTRLDRDVVLLTALLCGAEQISAEDVLDDLIA